MRSRRAELNRCAWAASSGSVLMLQYHDAEWGVPVQDDRTLFEFLILEGAQAGLSWQTVLNKRDSYRRAFSHFDPEKIARYGARDVRCRLRNPGIIRNRLKIEAAIDNAKAFLAVQDAWSCFHEYIWQFVGGQPIQPGFRTHRQIPATTRESDAMSKDLRQRGFRFVGPTICYAFMQAVGMTNDHTTNCFRHDSIRRLGVCAR